MTGLDIENTTNTLVLTIDKHNFSETVYLKAVEIIHLQYLVTKAAFDESVLDIDEEMKENWWNENKDRILKRHLNEPFSTQ
jgi:hypothetical protein